MGKWKDSSPKIVKEYKKIKGKSESYSILIGEIDWGKGVNGIDIRHYSEKDEKPYKGITIPFEHCEDIGNILKNNAISIEEECDDEEVEEEEESVDEREEFDFDSMFNKVKEETKYKRDNQGLLRDENNLIIIPKRR